METEFRSSFFTIFISIGIADICQRFVSEFCTILPFDAYLQTFYLTTANNNSIAKIGLFMSYFLGYTQYIGHLLISINRYTAMSYPITHDKVMFAIGFFRNTSEISQKI
jgi:hypothetical protein